MANQSNLQQHIQRVWVQHWPLQLATVIVMTLVLMLFNLLAAGVHGAENLLASWGQGLELVVYLKDSSTEKDIENLKSQLQKSEQIESLQFVSKKAATEAFVKSLGKDSFPLLSDPKWNSPIPASFEAKIKRTMTGEEDLNRLKSWSASLKELGMVEDVFYGQGWIENFSRFITQSRLIVIGVWILSLLVGLLIVGNCIRLSFLKRKDEIDVLELVGATASFVRAPFIAEGVFLGLVASVISIVLSYVLHAIVLHYLQSQWTFWTEWQTLRPLEFWMVALNLFLGASFGAIGSWVCVRKINTGWSAATGAR